MVAAVASQQGIPSPPGSPMQSLQLTMQASMSQASGIGGSLRALSQRRSYMDSGWLCQDQVGRRKMQAVHLGLEEGVGWSCTLNAALWFSWPCSLEPCIPAELHRSPSGTFSHPLDTMSSSLW